MDINQPGLRLSQPALWASHTSISHDVGSIDVDTDPNDPFIVEGKRGRRKHLWKSRSKQDCNVADSQLPVCPSVQQVMTVNSNKLATKTNVINVGTSQQPVNSKKAVNKPLLIGNKISPGNNGHHPKAAKSWMNFIFWKGCLLHRQRLCRHICRGAHSVCQRDRCQGHLMLWGEEQSSSVAASSC